MPLMIARCKGPPIKKGETGKIKKSNNPFNAYYWILMIHDSATGKKGRKRDAIGRYD